MLIYFNLAVSEFRTVAIYLFQTYFFCIENKFNHYYLLILTYYSVVVKFCYVTKLRIIFLSVDSVCGHYEPKFNTLVAFSMVFCYFLFFY